MSAVQNILRAAQAAATWHTHQRRKGAASEPYINHLIEVAALVSEATNGQDPELIMAALLHDSVEDCEVPRAILEEMFGLRVAGLVAEMTDDKSLDKADRKRKQVETAADKSGDAKILKLADKTSNLRAVANSPSPDWSVARKLEYIRWSEEVVRALNFEHTWLHGQFNLAAANASQSIILPSVR